MFIIEDDLFILGKDFMRLKFKTSDKLPYNKKKIIVPVCVISTDSVFEERNWYCPQIVLQDCFYENEEYQS